MDILETNKILAEISEAQTRLIDGVAGNMRRVAAELAAKGLRGWLAMDSDGEVYFHHTLPQQDGGVWVSGGECRHILDTWSRVAVIVWKHSLTPVWEVLNED